MCRRYRSDKKVKSGSGDNQVKLTEVPLGYVLEVTHFACADMTTGGKVLELGYIDQAGNDNILLGDSGTQTYRCKLNGRAWVEAGEIPYGKVYSPTASDTFIVSCHGVLVEQENGE